MARLTNTSRTQKLSGVEAMKLRREKRRQRMLPALTSTALVKSQEPPPYNDAEEPIGTPVSVQEALSDRREQEIKKLRYLELELTKTKQAIADLDIVLKMFDPSHSSNDEIVREHTQQADDFRPPKSPTEMFFGTDDRVAVVKKILSQSAHPMTTSEIADAYARLKKISLPHETKIIIVSRISAILDRMRKHGHVTNSERHGWKQGWALKGR